MYKIQTFSLYRKSRQLSNNEPIPNNVLKQVKRKSWQNYVHSIDFTTSYITYVKKNMLYRTKVLFFLSYERQP